MQINGSRYHPATSRFLLADMSKEEILSVPRLSAGGSPAFCHFPISTKPAILSVNHQCTSTGILPFIDEYPDGDARSTI